MATRRADPFVEHLLELMAPLAAQVGPLTAKGMFGGHGLFYDGLMFAIVTRGQCYLKVDDATLPRFTEAGSEPFTYGTRKGERTARSYFSLPPDCLESAAAMTTWARLAIEASLRGANKRR